MTVFFVSLLLLLAGIGEAQWQLQSQQPPGIAVSGSEGPCGPYTPPTAGRRFARQAFNQPMNRADMLGVPPGMTVREAALMEIDVHNPFDLDLPEPGSLQPGMNDRATGRGLVNGGFLPNVNQPSPNNRNRVPSAVDQGRQNPNSIQSRVRTQITNGRFQPAFVPPTAAVPSNVNSAYPNQGYPPAVPYAPRWNCQCDHGGDCNTASLIRGNPYNRHCMMGYVCCCRMG